MREWTIASNEELKTREFEMLKHFRAVCEENDIPYSLAYGTLLGACRHGETILFEGEPFSCVSNVEGYLTDRYGDYRKLPPENERGIRHNFTAYHRPEKPNVLHFAHLDDNRFSGVNAAVKQTLKAQSQQANVAWCNVNKGNKTQVEGVQQFPFDNSFDIEKLSAPFCRPDLVVFQETHRVCYPKIARQLRRKGIPYITVPHGELSARALQQKRLKKWLADQTLFRAFIARAAAVQCLSDFECQETTVKPPKFVVGNGIALPETYKTDFRKKGVRFVFIGRMDVDVKGLDLLVEAAALAAEELRKNGAVITLYGPEIQGVQALRQQIAARSVDDLISLREPVLDDEKARVLLDADLFIQTSRHEGMPMGVLEAMSYGLPLVLTEGTTLAQTVAENAAGFAAQTDAESIAVALKQALLAAEEGRLLPRSQNARDFAQKHFSWEAVAEKTLKIYERLGDRCRD